MKAIRALLILNALLLVVLIVGQWIALTRKPVQIAGAAPGAVYVLRGDDMSLWIPKSAGGDGRGYKLEKATTVNISESGN